MQVIAAVVIWLLFVLAQFAALFTGLAALLVGESRYTSNIIHAQDCAAAAFLGWSGDDTISKECGRELKTENPCRFCTWLCKLLDVVLEHGHCTKEGAK